MSRSSKKGAFVEASLMKKVLAMKDQPKRKAIKTWSRKSTIYPEFVGLNFEVYNGKSFLNVFVTDDMVGHKLGEFVPTRTFKQHSSNNKAADSKAAGK
ncbi:MAG: 30S ribosomal protein S19 [Mycoplasma sp.]